jgi:hypothetical protein
MNCVFVGIENIREMKRHSWAKVVMNEFCLIQLLMPFDLSTLEKRNAKNFLNELRNFL